MAGWGFPEASQVRTALESASTVRLAAVPSVILGFEGRCPISGSTAITLGEEGPASLERSSLLSPTSMAFSRSTFGAGLVALCSLGASVELSEIVELEPKMRP